MGPTEHLWTLLAKDAGRLARWQRAAEVAYKASRRDRCKAHAEIVQALHEALAQRAPWIPPAFFPESGANVANTVDCARIADLLLTEESIARWDAAP
jgi:hypothetical protein